MKDIIQPHYHFTQAERNEADELFLPTRQRRKHLALKSVFKAYRKHWKSMYNIRVLLHLIVYSILDFCWIMQKVVPRSIPHISEKSFKEDGGMNNCDLFACASASFPLLLHILMQVFHCYTQPYLRQLCRNPQNVHWQSYICKASGTQQNFKLQTLVKKYATTWPFDHPAIVSSNNVEYACFMDVIFFRGKRFSSSLLASVKMSLHSGL